MSPKLGMLHFPVALAIAAILDICAEVPLVSGLGVYQYHQAPEYLLRGVPWSNLWFGGGLLALPYFGLAYAKNRRPFHPAQAFLQAARPPGKVC